MTDLRYKAIIARMKEAAELIVLHKYTMRKCASVMGIPKSTIYKDVTERLRIEDFNLCEEVREVINYNISVRHIRGGESTRNKLIGGCNNENNICYTDGRTR